MSNTFLREDCRVVVANSSGATYSSGALLKLKAGNGNNGTNAADYGLAGIVVADIADGSSGEVEIEGIHRVPCASAETGSQFAAVYVHQGSNAATLTSAGTNTAWMGLLAAAKTSGQTTADVILNQK
jgi:predicted RecA/RadA family phage recombinase